MFNHRALAARVAIILIYANAVLTLQQDLSYSGAVSTQTPASTISLASNTGSLHTSLDMLGHTTALPFATSIAAQPIPDLKTPLVAPDIDMDEKIGFGRAAKVMAGTIDPFQPLVTGAIPSQIKTRTDHPVPRLNIVGQNIALQTNKFYANFFLGDQASGTFTHPYSLTWSKGSGPLSSWGMAVSQIDENARGYGPPNDALPGKPASYFFSPTGIQHMIFSATELGSSTILSTSDLEQFSANAILAPTKGDSRKIVFPMVQGMGFITAVYTNLKPLIQSGMAITQMTYGTSIGSGIYKYTVSTNNGYTWVLYAKGNNLRDPNLTLTSTSTITGPAGFSGVIQIARNPVGKTGEDIYDASAGVYPTGAALSGSVSGTTGSYSISWRKAGTTGRRLLMWALPHHVRSFSAGTTNGKKAMFLDTTTKGKATAVVGDSWTMVELNLPVSLAFGPWDPTSRRSDTTFSRTTLATIADTVTSELKQDMSAQSNLDSMYYSGKALAKFAQIVYVAHDILKNNTLAAEGLRKLESAFSLFTTNQQQYPLVYESAWGGIVSSAGYIKNDLGVDFGNTAYNDHHFHYGYFIYAASIIGYLDPSWLSANKAWVNALVRDASNPSSSDTLFPQSRMFDWFHGHSWAHGLFASWDSKDEESSSEDTMFAYAIKMWGRTIGDASMEARGNLMLSVLARSLQCYMLYEDGNDVMPARFVGNKVSGIMFENKVDHTTYFGGNLEYVQGIHMLPILPHSALIRTPTFVRQEWTAFFANGAVKPADTVAGGWRGILYANLALWDAKASWNFFSQKNFDPGWLDGGASLSWALAYAAGRGGAR